MKLIELFSLGHTYYPQNISPFEVEFDIAEESIARNQLIRSEREKRFIEWEDIQKKLASSFGVEITDMTNVIRTCPVFYCVFILANKGWYGRAHAWISLLIPYCMVEFVWYDRASLTDVEADAFRQGVLDKTFATIKQKIDVQLFPDEMQKEILPNVELQHSVNRTASLREIFFTDYIVNA